MGIQQKTSSTKSKTHVGDLKDEAVMIPFTDCYGKTHVFQIFNLTLNEPIQEGLSLTTD
jgi:hypothetical protein